MSDERKTFNIIVLDEEARLPTRAHETDAGLDIYSFGSHTLGPGETRLIPTGLKIEVPWDHVGLVVPRSGRSVKRPFIQPNAPGTLDPGFQGELYVPQHNLAPGPMVIGKHERFAQILFVPIAYFEPKQVKRFTKESQRGEKGYGSSGE